MYASSGCQCCHLWVGHMQERGFDVEAIYVADIFAKKDALGVPVALRSCHTAEIGGYVVEGHVPAETILRFLAERPTDRGIAAPGMPGGSPGMESAPKVAFDVIAFAADGSTRVYARV
ncbi:MAG: metal-binding protein [Gemmatimonas sp.]|nr:metal-binding protein [Gemmatimonas sp.]